jgi:L-lactate dehydrogenase complex protein LldG
MSSSRGEILKRLRDAAAPAVPLPSSAGVGERHADPVAQFCLALVAVAGTAVRVPSAAELPAAVAALAQKLAARLVVSAVPDAGPGNIRFENVADPHALEGVDLAILPGDFGVAENGAVWVRAGELRHRGLFVVTQHLALVIPASEIVNDMHEACARVASMPLGYGLFIAGPSKTADIEQALVIGAHGARSCTVFVVG